MGVDNREKLALINESALQQKASKVSNLVDKLLGTNKILSNLEMKSITNRKLPYATQSKDKKIKTEANKIGNKYSKYVINQFFTASTHYDELKGYSHVLSRLFNFIDNKEYRSKVNKVSNKKSSRQEKTRAGKLAIEERKTELAQIFLKNMEDVKEVFDYEVAAYDGSLNDLGDYIKKHHANSNDIKDISNFVKNLASVSSKTLNLNKTAEITSLGEVYNLYALMLANEIDMLEESVENKIGATVHFISFINARKQEAIQKNVKSFLMDKNISVYVEPLKAIRGNMIFDAKSHTVLSTEIAKMDNEAWGYLDIIPEILNP